MELLIKVIVCFFAGMGAGIGTGFAGMSAATVISPMLITFLGAEAYQAVGIALASDVLASAVSAYIYSKNKNIDIKNGVIMLAAVLVFTMIGSYVSSLVPNGTMSGVSLCMTLLLGLKFLLSPVLNEKGSHLLKFNGHRTLVAVICGCAIGSVCGFMGAGGGLMILFVLTTILGYDLKTAVGTSVFIMTFTAFTGAASHFVIGGVSDWTSLILCIIFTLLWARFAARFANRAKPEVLNLATGIVLCVLGVVMLLVHYVF